MKALIGEFPQYQDGSGVPVMFRIIFWMVFQISEVFFKSIVCFSSFLGVRLIVTLWVPRSSPDATWSVPMR